MRAISYSLKKLGRSRCEKQQVFGFSGAYSTTSICQRAKVRADFLYNQTLAASQMRSSGRPLVHLENQSDNEDEEEASVIDVCCGHLMYV